MRTPSDDHFVKNSDMRRWAPPCYDYPGRHDGGSTIPCVCAPTDGATENLLAGTFPGETVRSADTRHSGLLWIIPSGSKGPADFLLGETGK